MYHRVDEKMRAKTTTVRRSQHGKNYDDYYCIDVKKY
jgi:hypothetical protein